MARNREKELIEPNMSKKHFCHVTLILLSILCLQGCSNTTLLRYSQNLSNSAKGSSEKVQSFYGELQKAHSQMRVDELRLQSEAATPLDPAEPGPICPFSADDVVVRVNSAKFIETCSVKLNELVRSKNPNEMQAAISDVNTQLSGFNIKNFDPLAALQSASSPITTSLKIVGRRGFSVWADRWLKQALARSDEVFVEQATLLKRELKADATEAQTRATKLYGTAERVYRKKVNSHAASDEIMKAQEETERLSAFRQCVAKENLAQVYEDILDAHSQLMTQVPDSFKKK